MELCSGVLSSRIESSRVVGQRLSYYGSDTCMIENC